MSLADDLEQLTTLHQRGALNDTEFAQAKARVLGQAGRSGLDASVSAVNRLQRSRRDRWIGGVCGGLAEATGAAAWIWRFAFGLFVLCGGVGALVYLMLWLFVPLEPTQSGYGAGPVAAG
ncbi:MAG: PspC domain-containing protein [Burkholderiaceae bacterium]